MFCWQVRLLTLRVFKWCLRCDTRDAVDTADTEADTGDAVSDTADTEADTCDTHNVIREIVEDCLRAEKVLPTLTKV